MGVPKLHNGQTYQNYGQSQQEMGAFIENKVF